MRWWWAARSHGRRKSPAVSADASLRRLSGSKRRRGTRAPRAIRLQRTGLGRSIRSTGRGATSWTRNATGQPTKHLIQRTGKQCGALGHRMVDDALDHIRTLRERPVWQHAPRQIKDHFDGPPPPEPEAPSDVYEEYLRFIRPYQLGNSHPRFWGWVAGTGTVMGMFAEMLANATDAVSGSFSYCSNNYVELQVVDWCRSLLGFPDGAQWASYRRVLCVEPDRAGRRAQCTRRI